MPTSEQGSIVRVPFPYTDRPVRQHRPALVVSRAGVGAGQQLLWVLMITSAENSSWPGDVSLGDDYRSFGLPAPSVVRTAKIATIEARHADTIGLVHEDLIGEVLAKVQETLGL